MFEGKIKPCLVCESIEVKRNSLTPDFIRITCNCAGIGLHFARYGLNRLSVNQWNIANTPPDELLYAEQVYSKYEMELPR